MTPFAQLADLLQDMFDAAELRDLIRRLRDGKALVGALPSGPTHDQRCLNGDPRRVTRR